MMVFFILFALIGLLPDGNNQTILHPPPSGDGSRQSCKSFRRADAYFVMPNFIDLTGKTFSRLTVLEKVGKTEDGKHAWAKEIGINKWSIHRRIHKGWPIERVLS